MTHAALRTWRTVPTRRPARGAAVVSLALVLAACGGDDGASTAGAGTTSAPPSSPGMGQGMGGMGQGSSAAPMTAAELDRAFIAAMVPHHQSAADMARVEVERGSNPQVKALAQRIIDAQTAEIAQLEGIAQDRFDFTPSRQMGAMTNQMMGMATTMDMTAQIEQLRTAANVDRMFLTMMIPHHASAITMADQERKNGADPELITLSQKIIDEQAQEIGQMQALLAAGA